MTEDQKHDDDDELSIDFGSMFGKKKEPSGHSKKTEPENSDYASVDVNEPDEAEESKAPKKQEEKKNESVTPPQSEERKDDDEEVSFDFGKLFGKKEKNQATHHTTSKKKDDDDLEFDFGNIKQTATDFFTGKNTEQSKKMRGGVRRTAHQARLHHPE